MQVFGVGFYSSFGFSEYSLVKDLLNELYQWRVPDISSGLSYLKRTVKALRTQLLDLVLLLLLVVLLVVLVATEVITYTVTTSRPITTTSSSSSSSTTTSRGLLLVVVLLRVLGLVQLYL